MQLAEAEKNFAKLVELVHSRGVCVDLERDQQVIARLMPVLPNSPLRLGDLNEFLRRLPKLGEDEEI